MTPKREVPLRSGRSTFHGMVQACFGMKLLTSRSKTIGFTYSRSSRLKSSCSTFTESLSSRQRTLKCNLRKPLYNFTLIIYQEIFLRSRSTGCLAKSTTQMKMKSFKNRRQSSQILRQVKVCKLQLMNLTSVDSVSFSTKIKQNLQVLGTRMEIALGEQLVLESPSQSEESHK